MRDELGGGAFGAFLGDLVAFGGAITSTILLLILNTVDLWVPFLSYLTRVADDVEFIPEGTVETALLIATVILILSFGYRIVRRSKNTVQDDEN